MTESVDNLILEHLKRFQTGQERIERKLEEIIARIGQLGISVRMVRMSERLEGLERRLDLS